MLLALSRGHGAEQSVGFLTRDGVRISCPNVPGARVPVFEVFAEDCYRLDSFLGPLLAQPVTVVDIGAHVGAFACQLAAKAPHARICCFEPSPTTADYLRRNVADNGFGDRITVSQSAVTARVGESILDDNGGGSALNNLVAATAGAPGVPVRTTTFDAIVTELGGIADVVKIDCEGGEYDLVLGSSPASWRRVQRIVLEYHPHPGHSWAELRAWFAEQAFAVRAEAPANQQQGVAWLERRG